MQQRLAIEGRDRSADAPFAIGLHDGLLTSVGSTNFDNRSFRLNDEATLNIVDKDFAAAQTATFEADLARAQRVSYAQWQARPAHEKFREWLASVIGSQL